MRGGCERRRFFPRRFRPSSGRRPEGLHSRSHREGTRQVIPRGTPRVRVSGLFRLRTARCRTPPTVTPAPSPKFGGRSLAPAASAYTSTMVSFPPPNAYGTRATADQRRLQSHTIGRKSCCVF